MAPKMGRVAACVLLLALASPLASALHIIEQSAGPSKYATNLGSRAANKAEFRREA